MTETAPIIVEALNRRLEFASVLELAEHVEEVVAHRGGIFDPLEIRCIQELAQRANGAASPEVHRIARQTSFSEPSREPQPPTPALDERIAATEVRLPEAEAAWRESVQELHETREHWHDRILEAGRAELSDAEKAGWLEDLRQHGRLAVAQAARAEDRAREDVTMLRARLQSLLLARDESRRRASARFFDPSNPNGPGLTLEQLEARRREEAQQR